ncbi:alpha/beta hydrolase [Rhodococcus sp. BP-252]|uniref:Lipase n=1 Tax=Rhodococcoides kyotonense TaxID=398843 RepID=A0A177YGQ8_9NOCA|nr:MULTISPECIES: alpha/beta hydrolase [Rhodococcus]MBY6414683.1 alpha/beta hydrolase [Rhodococcus sp. BP-320]MBY6419587.1 alpha/beta hydrolase [Rhodococcus sp. BP-321]MBY6424579.1 alpha/beta hydrolase [Rhodococcus sp. BP-324]MBY6429576.1 alpha/beta hydrolase [Rhodococcus sp. BP-323]MBY6434548.1 alpha/beta hydrolase [Rhodococcus sp. BP-322]
MAHTLTWHDDVSRQARVLSCTFRLALKPAFTMWPLTDRGIRAIGQLDRAVDRLPKPRRVTIEQVALGGVPCEKTTHPRVATGSLAGATVLYFHGGGFVFCGLATHRSACATIAARAGLPVYSVEYRQIPKGGIGTSIADAMHAYRAVLDVAADPSKVIVAGDSAGGYLAMKVAEIAVLEGLTPPAAVLGFSPLLNLDLKSHPRAFMKKDAYLPMKQVLALEGRWLNGPDAIPGAASPIEADPSVFPPVFLSTAQYELMRPDVEAMTRTLASAGKTVETHVWKGQVHAFPVLAGALPEGRTVLDLAVAFAARHL